MRPLDSSSRILPAWLLGSLLLVGTPIAAVSPVFAQQQGENLRREILDSQRRLEEIRGERARLQEEMSSLRFRVQDVAEELQNIERQLSASQSVLAEIDFQTAAATEQVEITTADLASTRERLLARQAILNRRLREIYKRGPLHVTQVLLGADSFSDLFNRYHYLRLIAANDRALIESVGQLEAELTQQNAELQDSLAELERLRDSKLGEVAALRQVEDERQRALAEFRSRELDAIDELVRIEEDEARLAGLVTTMERQRLEEERRLSVAGVPANGNGALSATDLGRLPWPIDGEPAYSFGLERRADGTMLRRNGVGIRGSGGAPVRAVRPGTVALAGPFEGYGRSVIVSHGGGYYTLYLYLEEIGVIEGRQIEAGQVVGTVGGVGTPEGPRVEFQLRIPLDGGVPQAVDPLPWLEPRPGTP